MKEGMQATHMRQASDFEVGYMKIVEQENYMREEWLGGHMRTAGHALVWVQDVYKKVLMLVVQAAQ